MAVTSVAVATKSSAFCMCDCMVDNNNVGIVKFRSSWGFCTCVDMSPGMDCVPASSASSTQKGKNAQCYTIVTRQAKYKLPAAGEICICMIRL